MAKSNSKLHKAKKQKMDEYYTTLEDITLELEHLSYTKFFHGKTVLCNCDDAYESNFVKYFLLKFNDLGLKKLIATCYAEGASKDTLGLFEETLFDMPDENGEMKPDRPVGKVPYKLEITELHDMNDDGRIDLTDVEMLLQSGAVITRLEGDGDFRSEECVELLKEADVCVSNPPFSLWLEHINLCRECDTRFIVIGNMNAITYKDFFSLLKDGKAWTGYNDKGGTRKGNSMYFMIPDDYEVSNAVDVDGVRMAPVSAWWYTDIDHSKRHEPLECYKKYTPEEYPTYDNYDAIEVGKTKDIPWDYEGEMGVPISFMTSFCPEQFEIVGSLNNSNIEDKEKENYVLSKNTPTIINGVEKEWNGPVIDKQPLYKRIVIKYTDEWIEKKIKRKKERMKKKEEEKARRKQQALEERGE